LYCQKNKWITEVSFRYKSHEKVITRFTPNKIMIELLRCCFSQLNKIRNTASVSVLKNGIIKHVFYINYVWSFASKLVCKTQYKTNRRYQKKCIWESTLSGLIIGREPPTRLRYRQGPNADGKSPLKLHMQCTWRPGTKGGVKETRIAARIYRRHVTRSKMKLCNHFWGNPIKKLNSAACHHFLYSPWIISSTSARAKAQKNTNYTKRKMRNNKMANQETYLLNRNGRKPQTSHALHSNRRVDSFFFFR
jgi:hypothetical protein